MPFPSIEDVAPRVVKGITRTVHINDFAPTTGVDKHRGCFVRWRVKSGGDPVLDTIKLADNYEWNPVEAVTGDGNYNNKPFGIIGSYPEKIEDADGGGVYGKLTVHELGGKVPVLVAFRYLSDNGYIGEASINLIGKKVWIYGLDVNIDGATYTVAVASDMSVQDVPYFIVRDVIRPLPLVKSMPLYPRDYGWLVVSLDSGFLVDGAIPPSS
jgi:hypothetical protein